MASGLRNDQMLVQRPYSKLSDSSGGTTSSLVSFETPPPFLGCHSSMNKGSNGLTLNADIPFMIIACLIDWKHFFCLPGIRICLVVKEHTHGHRSGNTTHSKMGSYSPLWSWWCICSFATAYKVSYNIIWVPPLPPCLGLPFLHGLCPQAC